MPPPRAGNADTPSIPTHRVGLARTATSKLNAENAENAEGTEAAEDGLIALRTMTAAATSMAAAVCSHPRVLPRLICANLSAICAICGFETLLSRSDSNQGTRTIFILPGVTKDHELPNSRFHDILKVDNIIHAGGLMYIDHIEIENFRTFRKTSIVFCHADQNFRAMGLPRPKLPNVNLLLANNGFGKTTLLKAIALSALGPAVGKSGIYPYRLIRRETGATTTDRATLGARFTAHPQDNSPVKTIESRVEVLPEGDLEILEWTLEDRQAWHPVFKADSDALFMVGYGATRRVSKSTRMEQSGKSSPRATRVMGLFEEDFSLRPLNTWLPRYEESAQLRGRYVQVKNLINRLLGKSGWEFTGKQDKEGEYLYSRSGIEVPFPALSDGYRAFLGWLGDLLYHVCETCPSGKKLTENRGIVMVDEVDLHLHPKWQMTVLGNLAKALPKLQFIVTSHSPLVVGSLEWMNIILMKPAPKQSSKAERVKAAVHGLDADQVLLTEFFGLESTRATAKKRTLKQLTLRAREGDTEAARALLEQMSTGAEAMA